VKFTPRGGAIELTDEHADDEVRVTISDSGVGIPSEQLGRIFELFTQVHYDKEGRYCDLGIGLTLVKRLVEMHGGQVEVQSAGRNLGTAVIVRLPAEAKPARAGEGKR